GYTTTFVDIRKDASSGMLHLKSGLAYVGDDRLVLVESLAGLSEFRRFKRILVPAGEEYAANCIRVNEHILIAAGYLKFKEALQWQGYKTISLSLSEFQKMDGGLSCLSLRF